MKKGSLELSSREIVVLILVVIIAMIVFLIIFGFMDKIVQFVRDLGSGGSITRNVEASTF
jgi:hypothetical protein